MRSCSFTTNAAAVLYKDISWLKFARITSLAIDGLSLGGQDPANEGGLKRQWRLAVYFAARQRSH